MTPVLVSAAQDRDNCPHVVVRERSQTPNISPVVRIIPGPKRIIAGPVRIIAGPNRIGGVAR